jgi:RNA polymerase-binding transcription factor DksA
MNRSALTENERRAYRRRLGQLTARLSGDVAELKAEALRPTGSEGTVAEAPAKDPVVTSTEGDEDVARLVLLTEEEILAEARAALERLDRGTFGRCEGCGRPISRQRLNAVPYARMCICCARTPAGDQSN